ncbi:class I SAM-dependent methyltransferase [Lysinibacillus sp. FSL K6-0057]|uniref:class I SAM-dependent methyltransferase n=1 Tax=Lysinibacillus sp. FSL K6-0057 TaxID=2921411 RepID=UPI00315AE421
MNFSIEWEDVYKNQTHLSIWPWSDVVSYVKRYMEPSAKSFKVLELGCGAGANIPFFKSLNIEYHAIEGSQAIVEKLHKNFPEYKKNIVVGDFTTIELKENYYDLILDRAALTHNSTDAITTCLKSIYKSLKIDGRYIGIDWFSTIHDDFNKGEEVAGDPNTKTNINEGQFVNLGKVHFSDKEHLINLFADFTFLVLEHKVHTFEFPNDHTFASWNFVVGK